MSNKEEKPKIVSDNDWKKQAAQEKEKISHKKQPEAEKADAAEAGEGVKAAGPGETAERPIPPANFMTLVNTLMLQSLLYLGKLGDPNSEEGKKMVNPDLAKHHIDLLGMLEEKTKGNLTDEENKALSIALHEVRMLYVQSIS